MLVQQPNRSGGKVISRAGFGDVLPVCARSTAGYEALLLDPDHLERVAISPLTRVLASCGLNSK